MRRLLIASLGIVALASFGSCAAYHQSAAESAMAQARLDDAAVEVQAALSSNPDNLRLKQLAAEIFTRRGAKFYQNNEMIAAADDFRRAVDYDQFHAQGWDYLGLIAFSQHRWQQAIDFGHKAAELEGKGDPAYVQQAEAQLVKVRTGGLGPPHRTRSQARSPQPAGPS